MNRTPSGMVLPFVLLVIAGFSSLVTSVAADLVRQSGDVFLLQEQVRLRQASLTAVQHMRSSLMSRPMKVVGEARVLPARPVSGELYRSDEVCRGDDPSSEGSGAVCSLWLHWYFTRDGGSSVPAFSGEARWQIQWEVGPLEEPVDASVVQHQWRYHP